MSDAWPIDHAVLDVMVENRTPWLDAITRGVGIVGTSSAGLVGLALLGLVAAVVWRAWRPASAVSVAVLVAGGLAGRLKELFGRPRPDTALQMLDGTGYAFPSSHAAFTSAAAAALVCSVAWRSRVARRRAAMMLVLVVGAVGVMMIYLGSHWFSDVLVGWGMGTAIGAVIGVLLRGRAPRARSAGRTPDGVSGH